MKLRVGLDVDGVIFDFVSAFREQAQNLLGRKFPKFSSDWEFGNWNLNPAEWDKLWGSVRDSHNWFENEKPINKKTVEYVKRLDSISELCFITNRMPTQGASVLRQTQEQLFYLAIDFPTVLVRRDKGPAVAGLELDVFVDDYIENLRRVEECSPNTKLFLVNQTYNENLEIPGTWTRVDSLKEVLKYVKEKNVALAN
jgi:uncharacterized HAD superfamily protein